MYTYPDALAHNNDETNNCIELTLSNFKGDGTSCKNTSVLVSSLAVESPTSSLRMTLILGSQRVNDHQCTWSYSSYLELLHCIVFRRALASSGIKRTAPSVKQLHNKYRIIITIP